MPENIMKWIALGDIHQSLSFVSLIPEINKLDGIIITGDITNNSPQGTVEKIWTTIYDQNPNILAQIGNMDRADITEFLKSKNSNLHLETRELAKGIKIMGVGYSVPTPFGTPSEVSEEQLGQWLEETYAKIGDYDQLILAVHDSPYNTKLDILSTGQHVGSRSVRTFIEKVQPDIVVSGHIHESSGEDFIGSSHIFNPGMASGGGYVLITLHDGKLKAVLKGN